MGDEIMNNISETMIEAQTQIRQSLYCHQCHKKRSDIVGNCVTKRPNTTCMVKYCRSCLWNRKEQGKKLTGFLRENGSSSDAIKTPKNAKRQLKLNDSSEGYNEENPAAGKRTKPILKKKEKSQLEEVKLPQGSESITVFGIDLPSENAGRVLQFLEFCSKFGKALGLRGGEPQLVVSEIVSERNTRSHEHSTLTQMIIQLLTLILVDTGDKSVGLSASDDRWFNVLGDCFAQSEVKLDDFPPEMFQKGIAEYEEMGSSQRLKLLNFLVLRDCFANPESVEKKKEAKEKLNAAKANEQKLYQKLEDEFSKAQAENNGVELTIKQRLAIVSQMEAESELVFAGMQNALKMQKVQEYDDVLRTSPVGLDDNGLTLWKLKSYNKEPNILLQDLGSWSDVCPHERWFAFSPEQKPQVEKYIACKKVDHSLSLSLSLSNYIMSRNLLRFVGF
uniref:DDT domain-containing protein n=1 Tax=Brassica campestris TaxID=3711 RepID=M4EHZ7_BRACM